MPSILVSAVGSAFQGFKEPAYRSRALVILAGILVCVYAGSVHWYVMTFPEIGLDCVLTTKVTPIHSDYVYRYLPDSQAMQSVDESSLIDRKIASMGDHSVKNWPEFLRALLALKVTEPKSIDKLDGLGDSETTYIHTKDTNQNLVKVDLQNADGEIESVWCQVKSLLPGTVVPSILWFFLKLGLFLVGALVLWKRPDDRSAFQFFLLCIVTFGAFIGGYHWSRIITLWPLLLTFMLCGLLLPPISLHFYLIFPRPKEFLKRHPRATLLAVYGPALAFMLLLGWNYVHIRWLTEHAPAEVTSALQQSSWNIFAYFGVAVLWYLASIVCLIHSYRTTMDVMQRNQVKWILYGTILSLVPIGYTLYLALANFDRFGTGAGTWTMFAASVCVTAAFTISITRYRLMQLDQIISSGVVFFLLSSLAGLVYYGVVFAAALFFSQWIAGPSLTHALLVTSATLILLLVLDVVRGRVKRVLDRRFYREKYQLDRTLRRMSQAVEQLVDQPTLARRLLQASAELFGAAQGAVYLRVGDEPLYRLTDSLGHAPPLNELSSGCPVIEVLQSRGTLVARGRTARSADPAHRQLEFLGGEVACAMFHEGKMLALLILGAKHLGAYGADDLNLLSAFAQITALALKSTQGHHTIEMLSRDLQAKVEKISEQQRRILALQSQLTKRELQPADPIEQNNGDGNGQKELAAAILPVPVGIVGSSDRVRQLLHLVRKVSASPSAVLIRGESGTGKELLARALHDNSTRASKAFVKVHCAALSPSLLESELFGHVKGAFTGAHRDKVGRFELADGGTVFLDEIGDISLEVQTKLLRVLQEMTFERVGSSEPVKVDVRVIAATHQDLEQFIAQGRFRADLYYRLNVISITVPPLRERREDIAELAAHFLRLYAQRCGKEVTDIDDDALAALKSYDWPGNIRQLENVLERAVVVGEGAVITRGELPPELLHPSNGTKVPLEPIIVPASAPSLHAAGGGVKAEREERGRREREQLVRALAGARGNKTEAARSLGMARSTLVSRLKKHGLQ